MANDVVEEKNNRKAYNYFVVLVLFAVCVVLVLYLCGLYKVEKEEQSKVPVIRDSLAEIFYDDLDHYVLDNPMSVIYMCTATDDICRNFEKSFKKLLKQEDYDSNIVYLNLTDLNQEEFVASFNKKYPYKDGITSSYPAFVIFEDGKVKNILQGSSKKQLTVSKVKSFLEFNNIGE